MSQSESDAIISTLRRLCVWVLVANNVNIFRRYYAVEYFKHVCNVAKDEKNIYKYK